MTGQKVDRVCQIQGSRRQAKRLFGLMGISESPTLVTMGQDGDTRGLLLWCQSRLLTDNGGTT